MGNIVTVQCSCDDQTLSRIFRCLFGKGYIQTLKENLRDLKREFEDLKAIQHEVQNKVTREQETGHQQKLKAVQVWLERVEKTDTDFDILLNSSVAQLQKLCLCGLCSKNVCLSYKYGEKVFLLLEEVKKLKSEGNFKVVTESGPRCGVEERPTRPTIGHETILEKAWNRLMEDEVPIMGLHGMGGVGKTTLFKKMYNKFTEIDGQFKFMIWVVVSKGAKISMLQDDIAEKLHLRDEVWTKKSESDKAAKIHNVLKGKKFVLMLDDIWEEVDLEAIGIPFPTKENGCKIAFTTRSRDVCGWMGDHEPIQVKCLEPEEAWELFENTVGGNTLRSDLGVVKLARKVAEKCGGLPLALNVIGKTMASKTTVQEWEHAVDVLTRSAAEYPNIDNKILSILMYSYDSLGEERIKKCFLYCALFPEDYEIMKEELIGYWICEGFMRESRVIKRAMNEGYEILGTLIRANLLMAAHGTSGVVMHDVVREMALWIASDFVVQARMGLCELPKLKDWDGVKRISLIDNEIEEITCGSRCSELTTLFLRNNNLKNLSGEFIQSMQKLVVLDLSNNSTFNELPEQITELVSLQNLNLSYTRIKQLPVGFQELKKLTHLNLSNTSRLYSISGISKSLSLRILKLFESNVHGDVALLKELQLLEHLQVLNLTISTKLGLDQIRCDQKLANCINYLQILGFQQEPFNISSLVSMENLQYLIVEDSHFSEVIIDMKSTESISPWFRNLIAMKIKECNNIKDLTWLLFAPNLVMLNIVDSKGVEEIINIEKETNLRGIITVPLERLELLRLKSLPKLKSIYPSPLPFPFLSRLYVEGCPELRKLPLNASSVPQVEEFRIQLRPRVQLSELEWEDEDTKNRFLPSFDKRLRPTELEWDD